MSVYSGCKSLPQHKWISAKPIHNAKTATSQTAHAPEKLLSCNQFRETVVSPSVRAPPTVRRAVYVTSQGQGICFVSAANQLLLCKWLAPSLLIVNSTSQRLTNGQSPHGADFRNSTESHYAYNLQRNSPRFTKPDVSSPCSQGAATGAYPEPDACSTRFASTTLYFTYSEQTCVSL